jgi:hypothetical protein
MGELLNSGSVGRIQTKALQEQRELVAKRWTKTGLLEGLNKEQSGIMGQLLENQAGSMLNEAANTTAGVAGFDTVAFPMVRRVFASLLANEIVSVQPMNLPSGLLFYMDHQISADHGTNTAFTSVYDAHANNAHYADSKGAATVNSGTGYVTAVVADTSITVAGFNPSDHEEALSSLRFIDSAHTAIASSNWTIDPQTWTEDMFAGDEIKIQFGSAYTSGSSAFAVQAIWDEYTSLEGSSAMSEVKLVVTSVTVQAQSRKLKAHWTPELAQDLAAYHSLDAEAELTALLSEECAAEIDREIIRDLINVAPYKVSWDYDIGSANYSAYQTQKTHNQTLLTKINRVSAQIHKATLRGGANWIVCSTEIASVLEDLDIFKAPNATEDMTFNMGIESVGSVGSRYKVYKDPYLPSTILLMGHKGTSFLEAGYVYAPYIPFQLTPTIQGMDDFTPRKGIMTRYAKKVVNNKFYGLVNVSFPSSFDTW